MQVLRTPDDRFADLPDWPWEPRYAEVGRDAPRTRMAYVDAGPADGPVVVVMHGEPTWSYLYRHVIARLAEDGCRVIAPDLIGFGRSDKPVAQDDLTYARHVDWVTSLLVDVLDLREVTLLCQDWGGLLGLRIAAEQQERFTAIVASNTMLPTGDRPLGEAFETWRAFSQSMDSLPTGQIVQQGTVRTLSDAEVAAYDAPFPGPEYQAAALRFPLLVPAHPDDPAAEANRAAWAILSRWERPFVCVFGDSDPVTRGADALLIGHVPGAAGQPHVVIPDTGHFSQEDVPGSLTEAVLRLVSASR